MVDTTAAGHAIDDRASPWSSWPRVFLGPGQCRHRSGPRPRPGSRWRRRRGHRRGLDAFGPAPSSPRVHQPPRPALRPPGGSRPQHVPPRDTGLRPPRNNFAPIGGRHHRYVYPGLMTRPFITMRSRSWGRSDRRPAPGLDSPLQDGVEDWNALAPVSSLMSAGDVLVQYDQAYERYGLLCPSSWPTTSRSPQRACPTRLLRQARPNVAKIPEIGEESLGLPENLAWPAPLVSYTSTTASHHPGRVDLDPTDHRRQRSGIVNSASVGLLAGNPTILYAGTLDTDPNLRRQTLSKPATSSSPTPTANRATAGTRCPTTRLHRDGQSGARHVRPERRHRSSCSGRAGRLADHSRPARHIVGHRLLLRLFDLLPPETGHRGHGRNTQTPGSTTPWPSSSASGGSGAAKAHDRPLHHPVQPRPVTRTATSPKSRCPSAAANAFLSLGPASLKATGRWSTSDP